MALVPRSLEDVIIGNQLTTERGMELQAPVMEEMPSLHAPVRTRPQQWREHKTEALTKNVIESLGVGTEEMVLLVDKLTVL